MKSIEKISINMLGAFAMLLSSACVITSCGETKRTEIAPVVEATEEVEDVSEIENLDSLEIIDGEINSEDVMVEDPNAPSTSIPSPSEVIKSDSIAKDSVAIPAEEPQQEEPKAEVKRQAMEIDSPEGWTRVRKEPTTGSRELFKVKAQKKFYVTKIEGSEWYKFYWTEDGEQEGYINGRYIKPIASSNSKDKETVKVKVKDSNATGKYHVIIGSFDDFDNAKAKYEQLSKWADAEMFYEKSKKKYRVSIYSSTDKLKAENVKADVANDGYPDAWILKY